MSLSKPAKPNPTRTLSQQSNSSSLSDTDEIYDLAHIQDPIHGYIEIPDRIKDIIDTPHFQRLRNLKQLGTSYWVFPGASHNRFEHSIGVMHLAKKILTKIKHRQPKLNITEDEIFCVSTAGLLHDLGHGPFSHVFDHEFVPSIKHTKFRHEDMSVKLIEDLFKTNDIDIDPEHLLLIQALVSPSTHPGVYQDYKDKKRGFLFEIVANEISGIDVDKWDYFLRDSQNIGISVTFSYDRLMEHVRVINDHLCWNEKTGFQLYEMFRTRYELFKTVYSHKASKSIEYMICDILRLANDIFDITGKVENCKDYLTLTDSIIQRIEFRDIIDDKPGMENLKKAQDLIQRLHKRQLYKPCGYLLLTPEAVAPFNPKPKSKEEEEDNDNDNDVDMISTPPPTRKLHNVDDETKQNEAEDGCHAKIMYHDIERKWSLEMWEMYKSEYLGQSENEDEREGLSKTDIVVQLMSLSFGMETQHPIEKVFLYNSKNASICKQVSIEQISNIGGGQFREIICRAYVKDARWKNEMEKIFNQFAKKKGLMEDGFDDAHLNSLVISPPRTKSKTKKRYNNDNQEPLSPIKDNNDNNNNRNRKRKRMSLQQSLSSPATDLLNTSQPRNKKPRQK